MADKSAEAAETPVKALDLTYLLRDAFQAGRGLKDGDRLSEADIAAWAAYDPSESAAFKRVSAAIDQVRRS